MTQILLIRHAEPTGASEQRFGGDPGLSPLGTRQAFELSQQHIFDGVSRLYSSPSRRAIETAEPIGRMLGIETQLIADLREIDFGLAEGLNYAEIESKFPQFHEELKRDWRSARFPGGESPSEFKKRVLSVIAGVAKSPVSADPAESTIVAVTHAGVIRAALEAATGIGTDPEFASVATISWRDGLLVAPLP